MDTPTQVDVVVVGAGPAGCAAALHLSRGGAEVVVVDRARRPRDKACGEGLMPHGVAELATLGLEEAVRATAARPFAGIVYRSGRHQARASFPDGEGLGVRRLAFDAVLLEATRAEARVFTETAVSGVRVQPDGVLVDTDRGAIRARAVVGADGAHSLVRRQLGLHRSSRGRLRYGGRQHLRLRPGVRAPDHVEVHFGRLAEVYVTPVGPDTINIAVLCDKASARLFRGDVGAGIREVVAACGSLDAWVHGATPVSEALFCGPLRQEVDDVVHDRALLVGDAAGFLDPITGEGMSIGLVTARLAARTLLPALGADRLGADALEAYRDDHHAAVVDPLRLTELVLWWAGQPALRGWVIDNLARNPASFESMLGVIGGSHTLGQAGLRNLRRVALRF